MSGGATAATVELLVVGTHTVTLHVDLPNIKYPVEVETGHSESK
jgi:hypothetical protein